MREVEYPKSTPDGYYVANGPGKRPYYNGIDYCCSICGEPWDSYGVRQSIKADAGDMSMSEAKRFLRGEGCPACEFGRKLHFLFDAPLPE